MPSDTWPYVLRAAMANSPASTAARQGHDHEVAVGEVGAPQTIPRDSFRSPTST